MWTACGDRSNEGFGIVGIEAGDGEVPRRRFDDVDIVRYCSFPP
ncbi:hypothetical protein [Haladaptatus halobius]|nr:hypothetical protein [Haladaptatus halobius]